MSAAAAYIITWAPYVGLSALAVALVLAFVRMVIGPTLPDRIVALDTIAYLCIGFIAISAIVTRHEVYLDAAATLALIAFVSTVALARHASGGDREDER
jgi:multicomponent Na+:H+ antiporter subunit F